MRSLFKKGSLQAFLQQDFDIIIWTEVQASVDQLQKLKNFTKLAYPFCAWNPANHPDVKYGYSGISIWSKFQPSQITFGLPADQKGHLNSEGRVLTLQFKDSIVIGMYAPASAFYLNRRKRTMFNACTQYWIAQMAKLRFP